MIESLLGNATAEKVLLYIANYGEGHISGIADTFGIPKSQVRKQILKLEGGGILVGRSLGNTQMFQLNPRLPFKKELENFLEKILSLQSFDTLEKYYRQRRRPRRTGKKI
jgi:hypothetical protein